MLATSQTPTQMAAPAFSLNLPDEIPSTSLRNSTTYEDVLAKRNRAEQDQFATQQLSGDYQNLFGRIGDTQNSPLSNPDQVINRLLLNRPTDTQSALDTAGQNQAQNTREFAGDYAQAGTDAREQFALPELQGNLAETRNRIAERTTQLRQTLRDFETNAERRGVDRQFVDAEKQAVQGKAAAELADLSIIENAQLGNLEQAQAEVDRVLVEKRQGFEMENMAIEQEIARLGKMDTREADIRKEQLQIALGERSRNIETALASEKESRGYLIEAANNGADNGTLDAIRNAKTPGEAAMLAGPWVGRIQRMQAEASIRASNASAARSAQESNEINFARRAQALELAMTGDPEAIKYLGYDPSELINKGKQQEEIQNYESASTELAYDMDVVNRALKNDYGLQTSVGAIRNATLSGLLAGPNLIGGVVGAVQARTAKDNFLNDVNYLINKEGFQRLQEIKARSGTLGQITEKEFERVSKSASVLNSSAIRDDGENLVGFRGDEAAIRRELDVLMQNYTTLQDKLNAGIGLDDDELSEIDSIR